MKAVFAAKQTDGPTRSSLSNCLLIAKHDEQAPYLFYFPDEPGPGAGYVNLDGYLVCPKDMFSPRQIKMATKKYAARRAAGQGAPFR